MELASCKGMETDLFGLNSGCPPPLQRLKYKVQRINC